VGPVAIPTAGYNACDVSNEPHGPGSKQARRELRRQAARRRRLLLRLRQFAIVGGVLLVPALWAYEYSGPEEIVDAKVIRTQRYEHRTQDSGSHTHIRATLLIEGLSEATIQRADAYQRDQIVPVWIQRGRISGWPHFQDLAKPGEDGNTAP
jgi:hypothetical protein